MSLIVCNAYGEALSKSANGLDVKVEDKGSHSIARIRAPGYLPRTIVLKGAGIDDLAYLGFNLDTATVPDIDSLEAAAATNFHAAMQCAFVEGDPLISILSAPVHWQQDRLFYAIKPGIDDVTLTAFARTEAWVSSDTSLHRGPPVNASDSEGIFGDIPWTERGGWKQTQVEPGLQIIVWWHPRHGFVLEVDIDEHKDIFGHAYEVLRNHATGRLTHPHVINQALARKRGIISYRLEVQAAPGA